MACLNICASFDCKLTSKTDTSWIWIRILNLEWAVTSQFNKIFDKLSSNSYELIRHAYKAGQKKCFCNKNKN